MKKVILVMTVLFVLATALSTFGVDSATLTGLPDWANIMNNPAGGGQSKSVKFTSSGTFTVPQGVTLVWVTAWGGGGGGSTANGCFSGAGGSGEIIYKRPVTVTPGEVITVTVGAGGAGGVSGNGSDGGNTLFGSYVIAYGGKGGRYSGSSSFCGSNFCGYGGDGGGALGGSGANNGTPATSGTVQGWAIGGSGGGASLGSYFGSVTPFGAPMLGYKSCPSSPLYSLWGFAHGGAGPFGDGACGGLSSSSPNGQSAAPNSGAGGGGAYAGTMGRGGNGGSGGAIIEWIE